MYQLTYRSTAVPGIKEEDLEQILEESRKRNLEEDITGCLLFYQKKFVQILEGDKRRVLKVYAKIKLDSRHHSVELLWEGDVPERYFPNWSMGYYHHSGTSANDQNEELFINNMLLLSDLSNKTTSPLLSFWVTVRRFLNGSPERRYS
jgi:hypothetical protein